MGKICCMNALMFATADAPFYLFCSTQLVNVLKPAPIELSNKTTGTRSCL